MDNYLSLLKDSLKKKEMILIDLLDLSQKQADIVKTESVDWDEFNKIVDDKAEKIDRLMELDEGFESLFSNIKVQLSGNESKYSNEIKILKELIKSVTEKSASLQALEMRNKALIEGTFSKTRNEIKQSKLGQKAAINYYNRMNQINTVDPQLMDKNC